MFRARRREKPAESALQARRRVGELLNVAPVTLRDCIEGVEIDAGERPGVPSGTKILKNGVSIFSRRRSSTANFVDRPVHPPVQDRFGVTPICRVLSEHDTPIAPSTSYAYTPDRLVEIWTANLRLCGATKLWTAAANSGLASDVTRSPGFSITSAAWTAAKRSDKSLQDELHAGGHLRWPPRVTRCGSRAEPLSNMTLTSMYGYGLQLAHKDGRHSPHGSHGP